MAKIAATLRASFSPLALLGWLTVLVKPINAGLSMAGDVDLLSNYLGPIGRFLATGFGTLASLVIGAVIIGAAIYRSAQLEIAVALPRGSAITPKKTAESSAQPLSVELGNESDYECVEHFAANGLLRRTIKIAIVNRSANDIADCNVKLIAAWPLVKVGNTDAQLPIGFAQNFDLGAGKLKRIEIVSLVESGWQAEWQRDGIRIQAATGGGWQGGWTTLSPLPTQDSPAILTFEAFAPGIMSSQTRL